MGTYDLTPIKAISIMEVASRLGIVVKGRSALCFGGHDKNTMSLSFSPDKNLWHCFGCGKSGDSIRLVEVVCEVEFKEALKWFTQEFGVDVLSTKGPIRRKRLIKPSVPLNKQKSVDLQSRSEFIPDPEVYEWFVNNCPYINSQQGIDYLITHGISKDIARKLSVKELRNPEKALQYLTTKWGTERIYKSGIAWGEAGKPEKLIWTSYSIIFPFFQANKIQYLQGRMFQGNKRFINLRGISKPIYNISELDAFKSNQQIHICEGVPDALALCSKGYPSVAILGASSFREEWVDLFMKYKIILFPDGDNGGETFRRKIQEAFRKRGKAIHVVKLPTGKDIADFLAEMRNQK